MGDAGGESSMTVVPAQQLERVASAQFRMPPLILIDHTQERREEYPGLCYCYGFKWAMLLIFTIFRIFTVLAGLALYLIGQTFIHLGMFFLGHNSYPLHKDANKKALEQSEETVRHLVEELAECKKEISLLKSERNKWVAQTSFVGKKFDNLMRKCEEKQNELMKVSRELEEEQIYTKFLKTTYDDIIQSIMRQLKKKKRELTNALNAVAAAKAAIDDLERQANSLDDVTCRICLTNKNNVAFGCGHMACWDCRLEISICHMCRRPITSCLEIFS